MTIVEYKKMRSNYTPESIRLIFILESPPSSGKYFYNKTGEKTEPLFSAMMKLLELFPISKEEGLQKFAESGFLIVDSIYKPINLLTKKEKNEAILNNYPNLIDDILSFGSKDTLTLFLVKSNICKLLEGRLSEAGFKILNYNKCVPFPSHGHQNCFHLITRGILENKLENWKKSY